MNVLLVDKATTVRTHITDTVRTSRPETGRLVAHLHAMAPLDQHSAVTMAVEMLATSSVVVNNAAGTTQATPRLTAKRRMIDLRQGRNWCEGCGSEATVCTGLASMTSSVVKPGPFRSMCDRLSVSAGNDEKGVLRAGIPRQA
jgi:hypothetical protein